MQPVEPTQDVRRSVREPALTGRSMRRLGNPDVPRPLQHSLNADPRLGACERATGAGVQATAKSQVGTGVLPLDDETRVGSSNRRGSRLAAPLSTMTQVPAGISTPPTVVARRASRKSPLTGLSYRRHSSTKSAIRSGSLRSRSCSAGSSPSTRNAVASSRTVVSWPAEKRFAATRTTSITSGSEPSGNVASARPGEHVLPRVLPPVLDVGADPVVQVGKR